MTTMGPKTEQTRDPRRSTFDSLRNALLRSLDRHVVSNEAVGQAFRNLAAELELASLNDRLALPGLVAAPATARPA